MLTPSSFFRMSNQLVLPTAARKGSIHRLQGQNLATQRADFRIVDVRAHANTQPATSAQSYLPTARKPYVVEALIKADGRLLGPVLFGLRKKKHKPAQPTSLDAEIN